jgi:hypothetical protein
MTGILSQCLPFFFTVYYTIQNEKKTGERNLSAQPCWLGENSVPINKMLHPAGVNTYAEKKKYRV